MAAIQSLSGTGSCRLFAEFQRRWLPGSTIYIPVPTWANHHNIWRDAGVPQKTYRCGRAAVFSASWCIVVDHAWLRTTSCDAGVHQQTYLHALTRYLA